MTREPPRDEPSEMEPALPELARLRELTQLDVPSKHTSHAILARLQQTVSPTAQLARRRGSVRTWAVALCVTVAVPSAFAATPIGSTLVQRTVDWATRTFAWIDTTTAVRQGQRSTSERESNKAGAIERRATEAQNVPPQSSPPISVADGARATFDSVGATVEPSSPANAHTASLNLRTVAPAFSAAREVSSPVSTAVSSPVSSVSSASAATTSSVARSTNNTTGTLNAERRLLEGARVRMRAGDAAGALELASQHATSFPNGILAAERKAIINQVHALPAGQ